MPFPVSRVFFCVLGLSWPAGPEMLPPTHTPRLVHGVGADLLDATLRRTRCAQALQGDAGAVVG